MKEEIFLEILSGLEISSDAIESTIVDIKLNRLTEEQYHSLTGKLSNLNGFVEELKPKVQYELWEIDSVLEYFIEKVDVLPIENIDDARVIAKHLSRNWCENEEPSKTVYGEDEIWSGNSDFGILIKKIKEI